MTLQLLAIGRLRNSPEADLFARYNTRLRPALVVTEFAEGRGAPAEVKRRESAALLAAMPPSAFVIVLDQGGDTPDSARLAERLDHWLGLGRPICFVIGGAEGLDAPVLARANYVLSFGPLTWPHLLARAMLAEQLYRARAIAMGHPYHRPAGRPA